MFFKLTEPRCFPCVTFGQCTSCHAVRNFIRFNDEGIVLSLQFCQRAWYEEWGVAQPNETAHVEEIEGALKLVPAHLGRIKRPNYMTTFIVPFKGRELPKEGGARKECYEQERTH